MTERVFEGLLKHLENEYGQLTQAEIAKKLGLKQPQVSAYSVKAPQRASWWKNIFGRVYDLGYEAGQQKAASVLMKGLIQAFGKVPQTELAKALSVSQPTVSTWLKGTSLPTPLRFERLLALHVVRLAEPLCEFFKIVPVRSGASWKLTADAKKEKTLRTMLSGRVGIYVFYDSSGRVTYLGKTESDLWNEAKQRLKAKVNRSFYSPQKTAGVQQAEVARYISAYEVRVPAAIHNLEVLMLRSFPNDLANTNIGHFKSGL